MKDRWVGESFCLRQSSLILTDISGALRNLIWGIRVLGSILISLSSSDAFAKLFVSFLLLFVFNENFLIFRKNKIKTPPSRGSPGPFFWSESWARYPAKVIASLALAQVCSFWKNNHLQKFQREEDGLNLKYKKNNEIDLKKNKNSMIPRRTILKCLLCLKETFLSQIAGAGDGGQKEHYSHTTKIK